MLRGGESVFVQPAQLRIETGMASGRIEYEVQALLDSEYSHEWFPLGTYDSLDEAKIMTATYQEHIDNPKDRCLYYDAITGVFSTKKR